MLSLFDHDYKRQWPDENKFPINEETQGRIIKERLLQDINESEEFLIVTGFTSLANIIDIFGARDFNKLKKLKIVIGFAPEERVSKRLPHYSLPTEIKNYWLKQNVSIKLCGPILNLIDKIQNGKIDFRVINKVHSKIFVGDSFAMLGSSNFSKNGLTTQREANIRVGRDIDTTEAYQYNSIKQIADNYYDLSEDYNTDIIELLKKLLRDADWEEALARALAEVLESNWMKDFPELYKAIMSNELWPSQKIGIARAMTIIQDQGNVLLADPTGSGKTKFATALAYTLFHWLWENGLKDRSNALIISPKQVVENWESEQKHFRLFNKIESMGKLSIGSEKNKNKLLKDIDNADILVIDEAHNYLHRTSKRSKAVTPKGSTHVILSTATPINKKAEDLLRLIELLDIDNLSDHDLKEYLELRRSRNKKGDEAHLAKLKSYINQFIVRRTKKELNRMIDRDSDLYKNSNGHLCRYPDPVAEIYKVDDTEEDRAIASQIKNLLSQLKGINYLQKWKFPDFITTDDQKQRYIKQRLNSSPALASFQVRAALRSSHCALYEYIYGSDEAKKKYEVESEKYKSGNIIASIRECKSKLPSRKFPDEWLMPEYSWLVNEQEYQLACNKEIEIYEAIGELSVKFSGQRELSKAKFLIEKAKEFDKILAFDSTVLTLDYLKKLLDKEESGIEVIVATGQSEKNKRLVKEILDKTNFNSPKKLIALCSDAMSESINLQAAKALVLLDMPSVLRLIEQRIGRLERMDSEHSKIYTYWPDDSKEFSLDGDKRIVDILITAENLIGNNVEMPKGLYDKYFKQGLSTANLIRAYQDYSSNEPDWEGVKDSTQYLYSLIGKDGLITEKLYHEFKDVEASVKTAISFIESDKAWSFFAFKGNAKRSPKWLLIDHKGKATSDFSLITEKLKEYLKGSKIIQRRWNEVNTQDEIRILIQRLRKQENELLPWKKRRALKVAKKILETLIDKNPEKKIEKKILLQKVIHLFNIETDSDSIIDCNHFADLWLSILLPALDKKRKAQKRRRKIITLNDLTYKDVPLLEDDLNWIYDNCQYSETLDELIASCIIAVRR